MDKMKLAQLKEILQPMYIFHEKVTEEDTHLLNEALWFFFDENEEDLWKLISMFIQIQTIVKDGGIPVAKNILLALKGYEQKGEYSLC